MNTEERIQHFINVLDTFQNLIETIDEAGGMYNLEIVKSTSLIEFLDTCSRNNIRFVYTGKDKKTRSKIKLDNDYEFMDEIPFFDMVINRLEEARSERSKESEVRHYFNEVLDRLRVLVSKISELEGGE